MEINLFHDVLAMVALEHHGINLFPFFKYKLTKEHVNTYSKKQLLVFLFHFNLKIFKFLTNSHND